MISKTISHYHVISKLGAGGMGEVYLAEDSRLGRKVALKLLPASFQYDPERSSRFLREARAASALNSPNIAHIYDIGEHEGSKFIIMEYVEGESLSRRLKQGPLPLREAIDIAIQIAGALNEAHSQGIVHRDIKPSNLMITGRGLVKVLDFGIAKISKTLAEDDDNDLTVSLGEKTSPGTVLGTPSYMSPEQVRGLAVDGRSDIFSLGVVLYEMVTGRRPFEGVTISDIIAAVLTGEPEPITQTQRD
ncbi:MAG: serine/threonine protein kinase, partial [Nitrososphaera sp.]|nr:serine/threonine protein kinase [Nitrososphaera sp.]